MCDEILIQEEGESGAAVQSQIRVPMNPSFPLQQSLFKVCQEVNLIGPHAISKYLLPYDIPFNYSCPIINKSFVLMNHNQESAAITYGGHWKLCVKML